MAGQHWALAAKPPSPPGERDLGGTPAAATHLPPSGGKPPGSQLGASHRLTTVNCPPVPSGKRKILVST